MLEVAACQDWTPIPSCQRWSIPCALADHFPKSPGFPFAKAACPLPSRSMLHTYLLILVSIDSRSSSRAHLHPQSLSSPWALHLPQEAFGAHSASSGACGPQPCQDAPCGRSHQLCPLCGVQSRGATLHSHPPRHCCHTTWAALGPMCSHL